MSKIKLTDISIRALTPPETGQVTHWDATLPNFGLRVSRGGTKSWVVMLGVNRRRTTLGRFPALPLSIARAEAKRLLAEHTLGVSYATPITFENAVDGFLEACMQKNKPRTVKDYARLLNRHFKLGRSYMTDITHQEVMRRINKLSHIPTEQTHAFTVARAFFRWAVRNRYIEQSPLQGMTTPSKLIPRERTLTDQELSEVYRKALTHDNPFGNIVALCILTGQRRSEIAGLQWDWIDTDQRTISFPGPYMKNSQPHTFPYGSAVQTILEKLPENGPLLFPARGRETPFNGWSKCKLAFDKKLTSVEPYTLHDLRRTFASKHASLGTPLIVIEKLLNHISGSLGGVAGIYNRHTYMEEMRKSLTNYETYLISLL